MPTLPPGAFAAGGPLTALTQNDIVEMIFFPVVNEACRCLAEGVVVRAGDLDTAAILGMGFPPFRGGIVHWWGLPCFPQINNFPKKQGTCACVRYFFLVLLLLLLPIC